MRYAETAPYEVIATAAIDAETMQRIGHFARYWDRVANSGVPSGTALLLGDAPFDRFMASPTGSTSTRRTHSIAARSFMARSCLAAAAGNRAGGRPQCVDQDIATRRPWRCRLLHPRSRRSGALVELGDPERQRRHLRLWH